jgi:hypothetical protein
VRPTCASAATNSRIAFWLPGVVEAKGHSTTTAAKATAVEDGVAATSAEPGIKVGTPTAVPTIRAVKVELVVRKAVVEKAMTRKGARTAPDLAAQMESLVEVAPAAAGVVVTTVAVVAVAAVSFTTRNTIPIVQAAAVAAAVPTTPSRVPTY